MPTCPWSCPLAPVTFPLAPLPGLFLIFGTLLLFLGGPALWPVWHTAQGAPWYDLGSLSLPSPTWLSQTGVVGWHTK